MKPFLTNGAKIKLTPDPGWEWVGWDGELTVSPAKSHLKISESEIIHENDVPMFKLLQDRPYKATAFPDVVGIIKGESFMASVEKSTLSDIIEVKRFSPLLLSTIGKFTCIVMSPSIKAGAPPVPDPLLAKTGTWKVIDAKQNIIFRNDR